MAAVRREYENKTPMKLDDRLKYAAEFEARPAGVFARMEKASAYGFNPAHYDEVIDAVERQGKVVLSLSAKAMGALVKQSGRYDYKILQSTEDVCEIEFTDNGDNPFVEKMTRSQADKAGYSKGFAWRTMPLLMLFYRTLSQGVRRYCPDVLGGANGYDAEELEAFGFKRVDEDGATIPQNTPAAPEPVVVTPEPVVEEGEDIPGWEDTPAVIPQPTPKDAKLEKVLTWCEDPKQTAELSLKALEIVMMHHNLTEGSALFDNAFEYADLEGRKKMILEVYDSGNIPARYLNEGG